MHTCSSPSLGDESRNLHGPAGSHPPLACSVEVEVEYLDLVGLMELAQDSWCSQRDRKVLPRQYKFLDEARCRKRGPIPMRMPAVGVVGVPT